MLTFVYTDGPSYPRQGTIFRRTKMSGSKQQHTTAISTSSHLSPPTSGLMTTPQSKGVPLWFHGLMVRNVAEDLLLKNPQAAVGLFLVRQSSNRGGHFVISVNTGATVNHYLVETLESMFYVRRDRSRERGRDIQARDLCSLVHCYRGTPLDESGLTLKEGLFCTIPVTVTAPLTAMTRSKINHNYIPLHMDNREYIALEEFTAGDDLQALSFRKGEVLTVLQKESKNWWFAYNIQQDLGYIPASLVCNLKEWQQKCKNSAAFCNFGCLDTDGVFVSNRETMEEGVAQQREERKCLLDVNSNVLGICGCPAQVPLTSPARCHSSPSLREHAYYKDNTVCVSADYIAMHLRHREHQKLLEMQRVFDAKLSQQVVPSLPHQMPCRTHKYASLSPPDCRRDLKPRFLLRSQTEPANIHSAPPSPRRRTESTEVPSRAKLTKENVPCLLINALSLNEITNNANSCNNKQRSAPRPVNGDEKEMKTHENEKNQVNTNCFSQTDSKLVKLEDGKTTCEATCTATCTTRPDVNRNNLEFTTTYDPVATYLRLAECTTGPLSSLRL